MSKFIEYLIFGPTLAVFCSAMEHKPNNTMNKVFYVSILFFFACCAWLGYLTLWIIILEYLIRFLLWSMFRI